MKIAVGAEADPSEPRVAATPDTVKKMIGLGAEVAVQPGAGVKSGILDADYTAAGATVSADAVNGADIVRGHEDDLAMARKTTGRSDCR